MAHCDGDWAVVILLPVLPTKGLSMRSVTLLLLAGMIIAGCGAEDPAAPNTTGGTAALKGTIYRSSDMKPVEGAIVSTLPATSSIVTTTTGTFEFSGIASGAYVVTAAKIGLDTQSVTVTVAPRQTATADIILQSTGVDTGNGEDTTRRYGQVAGVVMNVAGAGISQIRVELEPGSRVAFTNGMGLFAFDSVLAGPVVLRFVLPSGKVLTRTLTVNAGQLSNVSVTVADDQPSGLIAWWPFDGSADDASGRGHHGENEGAVLAPDRNGAMNKAMFFNGGLSRIRVPHSVDFNRLPLTVSCWMRADGTWNATTLIISKFLHPSGEGWDLFMEGGILGVAYMRNDYASNTRTDVTKPAPDQWVHICGVFTADGSRLYYNGTRMGSRGWQGMPTPTTTTKDLYIGRGDSYASTPPVGFRGWLDDVRIYDHALTDDEVRALSQE